MGPLQETDKENCPIQGLAPSADSITVQVVLLHPSSDSRVFWVLNGMEFNGTSESVYHTAKPRGWGNPGGSIERVDMFNAQGAPCTFEEMIIACGRREVEYETGFINFTFERYLPSQISFLRRQYAFGHRVLTLVAKLRDLARIPIKEVETGEIEDGQWFDLSLSPTHVFKNRPDPLYWSHIRRTIICLSRLARQCGKYIPIHPLWKLAFPMGKGDVRFPLDGYCLSPRDWYKEFKDRIACGDDVVNLDRMYAQYRHEIDQVRRHQAQLYHEQKDSRPAAYDPDSFITPEEHRFMVQQYQKQREKQDNEWREFGESLVQSRP